IVSFNLSERAYLFMRNKLALGELPPGTRLINRSLAKEIGVSLTPVREALNRMISEGLLEYRAGLGTFVPIPNLRDLQELYDLRKTLECDAVRKAGERLKDQDVEALARSIRDVGNLLTGRDTADEDEPVARPIFETWRAADTLFHTVLLRAAGNRRVTEMVANLQLICQIQQDWDTTTYRTVSEAHADHQGILDAVTAGRLDDAQKIVSHHIDHAWDFAVQTYQRRYMNGPHESVPTFTLGVLAPHKKNHAEQL
ncbi:MAG TPA: GntR family transcriptional regulator, partial [Thermoguttaceae bacterium]|nr:GntR family transcriptional regulator [Thermoguttaceae bacterium]